jgi:flavin-binding protein dodecin
VVGSAGRPLAWRSAGGETTAPEPEPLEAAVSDHVYRLSEIVGSSQTSVDDAIRTAIRKAAETVRHIEWFETKEIRGQVVDGDVNYFQVRLSVGFRVEQ